MYDTGMPFLVLSLWLYHHVHLYNDGVWDMEWQWCTDHNPGK